MVVSWAAWSASIRFLFYGFLLTAPLNLYGLGSGLFSYRFSRIFLVGAFACMVLRAVDEGRTRFTIRLLAYDKLLLGYASLALLSGIYVTSMSAYASRMFALVECLIIVFVIRQQTVGQKSLAAAIEVYALSTIGVTLGALYQVNNLINGAPGPALPFESLLMYQKYEDILSDSGYFGGVIEGFGRISSTFGEPNMMSGFCASVLPLVLLAALLKLSANRRAGALFFGVVGLGTILTMISAVSKAGLLSTVTGLSIFLALAFRTLTARQKRWILVLCAALALAVSAYVIVAGDLFALRLDLGDSGHAEHRLAAWNEYLRHPVIGLGFGNYEVVSAHTLALTALLELGIVGGILAVLLSVTPLLSLTRVNSTLLIAEGSDRWLTYAACYASYASILVGLYLYDYWLHPFTWISIGLLLSAISQIPVTVAQAGPGRAESGASTSPG